MILLIKSVWQKREATKGTERRRVRSPDVADAQPTVRPVFYIVAIVVSLYEIIAKLLLSRALANLINGRTLSLIHVICTYPPERRERLSS